MTSRRSPKAVFLLTWSGPQAPFLERYLRPEEARRPNPSAGPWSDRALVVLILGGVAAVLAIGIAVLGSLLLSFLH